MIRLLAILTPLLLAACGDDPPEVRYARDFLPPCVRAQFTPSQCAFLFALTEQQAGRDSSTVALVSGMAVGAAVSSGRR